MKTFIIIYLIAAFSLFIYHNIEKYKIGKGCYVGKFLEMFFIDIFLFPFSLVCFVMDRINFGKASNKGIDFLFKRIY